MHQPVLYHEIIHALRPQAGGTYLDGTLGAGGHAWGILKASAPDGRLLGLDVDPQALAVARERLSSFGERVVTRQASYATLEQELDRLGWGAVDGILLDLGVSSMQLDTPERGFSFRHEAPLDMRFDPSQSLTAADLVNKLPVDELADLIFRYGEERRSRQIARILVANRPIQTTRQLADLVNQAVGRERPGFHPATRTFQALRIAVNRELEAVEAALPQAVASLKAGGRLAVIAFHSLEDRIVKRYFRQEGRDCICPPRQPICTCGHRAAVRAVGVQPVRPAEEESEANPRARSARLRVVERI